MLPIIATAKAFLGQWGRTILIVFVAATLSFTLGYCKGKSSAKAQHEVALAKANAKALDVNMVASEAAAAARVDDALLVDHIQKELSDAIEKTPDTAPDAVRVQLGCARLRAQGTDTTAVSACR